MPVTGDSHFNAAHGVRTQPVPGRQRNQAAALAEALRSSQRKRRPACILIAPDGEPLPIPATIVEMLYQAAETVARGESISVMPVATELTTQQAADLLNVSRQYLVRLIDDGRIPAHLTGTHRRVLAHDLMAFKQRRDEERMQNLKRLSRLSQQWGGYDTEDK